MTTKTFDVSDWGLAGYLIARGRLPIRVDILSETRAAFIFPEESRDVAAAFTPEHNVLVEGYRKAVKMVKVAREKNRRGREWERRG